MARKKQSKQSKASEAFQQAVDAGGNQVLEIVLKCDVAGTVEAVRTSLHYIHVPGVVIKIIQDGVGAISKSDLLMAQTGSKLVIGFNVGVASKLDKLVAESGVEVRLYDVIYKLSRDIEQICRNLIPPEPEEKITGAAKVIATFKAGKGIILGCEITNGLIELKKNFRVITAMGPAYTGKIASLQVENKSVKSAKSGQQVGIQVKNWEKAKVGDLIECFETLPSKEGDVWRPIPKILKS